MSQIPRCSPAAVPHTAEHGRNECFTMLPKNPNNTEVKGNIRAILMLTGFVSHKKGPFASVPIRHLYFRALGHVGYNRTTSYKPVE